MASVRLLLSSGLFLLLTTLPGALCDDGYTIGWMVAAAGVSFILLAVIIGMIVVGCTWNSWYPAMQRAKGKVKMPRSYWKKKEEAKLRLLNGTRSGPGSLTAPSDAGLPNGALTSRTHDTDDDKSDGASWVHGWNNANPTGPVEKPYEEMALAMDLGEEKDDDFRIETTVVDDETLNLGPFTDGAPGNTHQQAASLEMAEDRQPDNDQYLYSSVNRAGTLTDSVRADATDYDHVTSPEAVTSFSKLDPDLVAF